MKLEIVPCPIIREADGLAKSSRNMLLEPQYRAIAPKIHQTLAEAAKKRNCTPEQLCQWITSTIDATQLLKTEYVQIVNFDTLMPVEKLTEAEKPIICIAVWAGKIRLIDNLVL